MEAQTERGKADVISASMPKQLGTSLRLAAKSQRRPLSWLVQDAVESYLLSRGFISQRGGES